MAHSEVLDLIKIGTAVSIKQRGQSLNKIGYGGTADWEIKEIYADINKARVHESNIHNIFKDWRKDITYIRNDNSIQEKTRELFSCNLQDSLKTVKKYMRGKEFR